MYVPELYRPPGPEWNSDLVRRFPLAILVSGGPERPFATHLPTVLADDLDEAEPAGGDLTGGQIYGHLNRQNPHWGALISGSPVTLVFQGPNGYVSPAIYETTPASPTWNFAAVHIHGALRRVEDSEATMRIVCATARALEGRLGKGWNMDDSKDYFRTLLPGVGAFEITIDSVDGMFKMSQEKNLETREKVSAAFSGSRRGLCRELAAMMNSIDG